MLLLYFVVNDSTLIVKKTTGSVSNTPTTRFVFIVPKADFVATVARSATTLQSTRVVHTSRISTSETEGDAHLLRTMLFL